MGDTPANEHVQRSLQELSRSAKALHQSSMELLTPILEINKYLQKLNLGIAQWVPIHEEKKGNETITRSVGYERINGQWGIAIETATKKTANGDPVESSRWVFSDAPRWLRLRALDHLPDLFDALKKEADRHKSMVDAKLKLARELAMSLSQVSK
jgi:hypothetical protein